MTGRFRSRFFAASLILMVVIVAFMAAGFLGPSPFRAERVSLPLARSRPGSVTFIPEHDVYVARKADGSVTVFLNRDPHLGHGTRWVEGEGRFRSPAHGEVYSMEGVCLAGPCGSATLYRVWSRVNGETLYIRPRQVVGGGYPGERRGS